MRSSCLWGQRGLVDNSTLDHQKIDETSKSLSKYLQGEKASGLPFCLVLKALFIIFYFWMLDEISSAVKDLGPSVFYLGPQAFKKHFLGSKFCFILLDFQQNEPVLLKFGLHSPNTAFSKNTARLTVLHDDVRIQEYSFCLYNHVTEGWCSAFNHVTVFSHRDGLKRAHIAAFLF